MRRRHQALRLVEPIARRSSFGSDRSSWSKY